MDNPFIIQRKKHASGENLAKIMRISVKMTTPMSEVEAKIKKQLEKLDRNMFKLLSYVGDECINRARGPHPNNWTDQRGPLRSSVGFVIVHDGKVVFISDFQQVKDGAEGSKAGRAYALELAQRIHEGWALIVVAGMHYASYVAKYRDVLQGAEQHASVRVEELIKKMLQQIAK